MLGLTWLILVALVCTAVCIAQEEPEKPKVNGRVEKLGPFKVVTVWGKPEEIGFAHGYLLADDFLSTLEDMIKAIPDGRREHYDRVRINPQESIALKDNWEAEIKGIFKGIVAAKGGAPKVEALKGPLVEGDLIAWNAWDVFGVSGCSGFTAWNQAAPGLGIVTARNFDFPVPTKNVLEKQFILVREPEGRKKVATVTWPGFIGAVTGWNQKTVTVFLHTGSGKRMSTPDRVFRPLALVLKDVLEYSDLNEASQVSRRLVNDISPYPISYLVRVVTARPTKIGVNPVTTIHIDAGGVTLEPVGEDLCITTNHSLKDDFTPATGAPEDSITRYKSIREKVLSTKITPFLAWDALKAVASEDKAKPTLHSVVVYPEGRKLELAFASWQDKFIPATASEPTTIKFADLFKKH